MIKYKFSFTSVSLAPIQMQELSLLFFKLKSWDKVSHYAQETNVLKYRTISSSKKIISSLIFRLKQFSNDELIRFSNSQLNERNIFAWIAVCRSYQFVGDFAVDALHEAFISGQKSFTLFDYEKFINSKIILHPEFNNMTKQTYAKIRQMIFKMTKEAGFLNEEKTIIPISMPQELLNFIPSNEHKFFPMYIRGR